MSIKQVFYLGEFFVFETKVVNTLNAFALFYLRLLNIIIELKLLNEDVARIWMLSFSFLLFSTYDILFC